MTTTRAWPAAHLAISYVLNVQTVDLLHIRWQAVIVLSCVIESSAILPEPVSPEERSLQVSQRHPELPQQPCRVRLFGRLRSTHGAVCMLDVNVNELPVGDLGGVSGRRKKLRSP
jgi:hypothetical protein